MKGKLEPHRPVGATRNAAPTGDGSPEKETTPPCPPPSGNIFVRGWRAIPRLRWWIIGIVLFLVAVRLALPFAVEHYVNRQLNRSKDYGGRVGNVRIQLWRGQYTIDNPTIFKRSGGVHVPLFSARNVFLAVQWGELFHGSVVGEVIMTEPHVNFVAGPTAAQSQTGQEESWDKILESLFPFDLNQFRIINGEIHFQNEHSTPPVDISMKSMNAVATNLTNSRKVKGELPAGVTARGTTIGGGTLDLQCQFNPMTKEPQYQVTMQLTNVDLTALNSFLQAYGKFDVERGQFALFASVAGKEGSYNGYLKVFFNHLNVFAWEKERKKNALEVFWDAIVGTVATIFKNHRTDSLATRVPISGNFHDKTVGTWTAVATLLRNAFIRALIPKLDEKVTLHDVDVNKTPKQDQSPGAGPPKSSVKSGSSP